ncbi:MAG: diguanylate cyclase [Clostridiales bacterium]|jgi:diguanylate cyclase (GGDEF)-like protein|nr:diguanylate cyclase [Clostridiales bacterium]
MDPTAEIIYNYIKDAIYSPAKAALNMEAIPEPFKEMAQGLAFYVECVNETRELAKSLSRGMLNAPLPSPGNEIAAHLKALHSTLKHLTWQTQQVAQGDYMQRVEFMGDFAKGFNSMVEQLSRQRKELIEEIELSKLKSQALEQSNAFFEAVTDLIPTWIIVVRKTVGEWVFTNHEAKEIMPEESLLKELKDRLYAKAMEIADDAESTTEDMILGGGARCFSVTIFALRWHDKGAVAFILNDVSEEREYVKKLENEASLDHLTQICNRRFGMKATEKLMEQKEAFLLCFVDIDNLKYVNDKFGHLEGDKYILCVVDELRSFSPDAILSRLGGDEFMLVIKGRNIELTEQRLEMIRNNLAKRGNTDGSPYNLSISYGATLVEETNELELTELLSLVDEKMYEYKREHKANRVNET